MARKVAASPEQESSDESDGQKKVEGKPWTFPREWESGIPNHKMLLGSTMNPVDTEQIERRLENTPDISAIKADFTPDEVQRILDHAKSEIEYYLPLRKEYSTLQHEWINTLRFEEGIVFRTREERRAYLESHYRGLNGTWTRIWTTKTRKDPTGRREWSLHVADPVQEVSLYRGQARLLEASDLLYQKMYQYIITRW